MKAETTTPHRESEIKVSKALVPGRDTAWQLEIESACVVYWYVCENVHYSFFARARRQSGANPLPKRLLHSSPHLTSLHSQCRRGPRAPRTVAAQLHFRPLPPPRPKREARARISRQVCEHRHAERAERERAIMAQLARQRRLEARLVAAPPRWWRRRTRARRRSRAAPARAC